MTAMLKPDRLLSLVEQGLISAANFAAMLVLARTLPGPSFGVFSFAWLTLLFMVNLHRSAVVVPFVIHTAGPGVLDSEGPLWRRLNAWATGLAAGGLGAAGGLAALAGPSWIGQGFAIGAVLILPAFWYEFRRRWSIQRDRYLVAVTAAAVYAGVAVGGAAAAGWSGRLDVATAAFALANLVACAVCTFGAPMPKAKVPSPPF
ncbi:MAG: hypothetical protein HY985_17080, partial [Magnetospirillum sp.]|nr:hypothetical protein [Magnetospirillum sp.]